VFGYLIGVDSTRQIRNIALIGFMGTGKSSVGRIVADALHFTYLDTDDVIEARAGVSISEIFDKHGEQVFRDWENRLVEELARRSKTVIATGGGLPANEANFTSLQTHALMICLWASPEKILQRVKTQTHRPLLSSPDPLVRIRELLAARSPYYRRADVLVNTDFRSAREVALQVLHQFHMAHAVAR
jgi:shikimate kinase